MNRSLILAWLAALTDKQFAEVFYEAAVNRDRSEIAGEEGHFLLAETSQLPGESRETVFIALPDADQYPSGWADDVPLCQTGQCGECGSRVRSIAKRAICPVCQSRVSCT